MIVAACQVFGHLLLCMPEVLSCSRWIRDSKRIKESETTVDRPKDAEPQASHEAVASEPAEEDGSLNRMAEYERVRIRRTRQCCDTAGVVGYLS
jgi:hypothetical protein